MTVQHPSLELEYYIKEGISPVHQDISDLEKHFQIRESLYFLLGLVPISFKGKDVIEVAAGSGHNSVYISSLCPRTFHLIEPNPVGAEDIIEVFENLSINHTKPKLFTQYLEDFEAETPYDIVICEGWLGGFLEYEKKLLVKLSSLVKTGGVLVKTFLPPIGGMATFLRRLLAHRLIDSEDSMKKKTQILCDAFSSHLNTMSSMSRSHEHWIQDSILNPYFCVAINTPSMCSEILGDQFTIYQSVPRLATDWRWYKSLHGAERRFTETFLAEYDANSHCLMDYRVKGTRRSIEKNTELQKLCYQFAIVTEENEKLGQKAYIKNVEPLLSEIIINIGNDLGVAVENALHEVNIILSRHKISTDDIADMSEFSSLFGREQCYLSFFKNY